MKTKNYGVSIRDVRGTVDINKVTRSISINQPPPHEKMCVFQLEESTWFEESNDLPKYGFPRSLISKIQNKILVFNFNLGLQFENIFPQVSEIDQAWEIG